MSYDVQWAIHPVAWSLQVPKRFAVYCVQREECFVVTADEDVPGWYAGDSTKLVAWRDSWRWVRLPELPEVGQ